MPLQLDLIKDARTANTSILMIRINVEAHSSNEETSSHRRERRQQQFPPAKGVNGVHSRQREHKVDYFGG